MEQKTQRSQIYIVGRVDSPGRSEKTHAFDVYPMPEGEDTAIALYQRLGMSIIFEDESGNGRPVHPRPLCDKKKRVITDVIGPLDGPQDPKLTCGVCRFTLEKRQQMKKESA